MTVASFLFTKVHVIVSPGSTWIVAVLPALLKSIFGTGVLRWVFQILSWLVLMVLVVIALAICFEGYAWRTAYRQLDESRRGRGTWAALRNSKDPEVLTVLAEDTAAIAGLVVAALGIGLASLTGEAAFDAAGSVGIGVILLVVAFLLGRENAKLLIGEGIDPQSRDAIDKAIREVDGVDDLLELLTMHLGPEEVLVTADVRFRDDLSTEEIARTIDRVEAAIREVAPEAKRIYVEPEIRWREEAKT